MVETLLHTAERIAAIPSNSVTQIVHVPVAIDEQPGKIALPSGRSLTSADPAVSVLLRSDRCCKACRRPGHAQRVDVAEDRQRATLIKDTPTNS